MTAEQISAEEFWADMREYIAAIDRGEVQRRPIETLWAELDDVIAEEEAAHAKRLGVSRWPASGG